MQLVAGLALGPPLLLILHRTPVPTSPRELTLTLTLTLTPF
jgi:hypothetical protein